MQRVSRVPPLLPKFSLPRLASKVLRRPRLAHHARAIEDSALTVVSAPSGFGKTTLCAGLAAEFRSRPARVAWLSLDEEDDDLPRFLEYLALAVGRALSANLLQDAPGQDMFSHGLNEEWLMASLINRIAEAERDFFLFIDDFHIVRDAAIHCTMQFFVRHMPVKLRLIVLARPHGVIDFGVYPDAVHRIGAADLRFTREETVALFEARRQEERLAAQAHALTGGWAAAVCLLAASTVNVERADFSQGGEFTSEAQLAQLLASALARLDRDEMLLLEATCIVGRMCAGMFRDLSGIVRPAPLFHALEHVHCLVSRISDDGHWVSCHELIRQAVLRRIDDASRETRGAVTRRAAQWHARQGHWREAVALAIDAGERALALQWIEDCAPGLFYRGDLLTLRAWERQLRLSKEPGASLKLLMTIALAGILASNPKEQEPLQRLLDVIETRLRNEPYTNATWSIHWHLQAIRAVLASRNDDLDSALKLAWDCLQQPAIYPSLTQTLRCVAGYSYLQSRQWKAFHEVLTEVPRSGNDEYTFLSAIYREILLGLAATVRLDLSAAQRHLEGGLALARGKLGMVSMPGALCAAMLGVLHVERMEFQAAEALLAGTLDLLEQSGYIDIIFRSYAASCRMAQLRGDARRLHGLLERWSVLASAHGSARLQITCAYEKLCAFLREGTTAQAEASLAHIRQLHLSIASDSAVSVPETDAYVALAEARYALYRGYPADAAKLLRRVHDEAVRLDDRHVGVLSGLMLAEAELGLEAYVAAARVLAEVLDLARTAGLKALLAAQALDLPRLAAAYEKHAEGDEARLRNIVFLEELQQAQSVRAGETETEVSLSPRERSVLQLLAQDKSNKEISGALQIAPETVKTHMKSIFAKLEVTRRNAAVRRALAMHLI